MVIMDLVLVTAFFFTAFSKGTRAMMFNHQFKPSLDEKDELDKIYTYELITAISIHSMVLVTIHHDSVIYRVILFSVIFCNLFSKYQIANTFSFNTTFIVLGIVLTILGCVLSQVKCYQKSAPLEQ